MTEDTAITWLSDPCANATMRYDAETALRLLYGWPEKFIGLLRQGKLVRGSGTHG